MPKSAPTKVKARLIQRQSSASPQLQDTEQEVASNTASLSRMAVQQAKYTPRDLSRHDVLQLQRHLGNQSVRRLLARPAAYTAPVKAAPHSAHIMRQSAWNTIRPQNGAGSTIQRSLRKITGKSSGWFRKGRRDKLNIMVEAYNTLEMKYVGSKKSAQGYQILIGELDKIWQAANEWKLDVLKKDPEKAVEIQDWMDKQVVADRDLKVSGIEEIQQAAALEDAWKGARYNPAYATAEFTSNGDAGLKWLATPEIAPVYKYHVIKNQFDGATLNAYEELVQYKQNRTAAEALRIYNKYDMATSSKLNITGEGSGGLTGVAQARATIEALQQDPSNPPQDFGSIEGSIKNVLNEIMISFRSTPQYKKITTAPAAL